MTPCNQFAYWQGEHQPEGMQKARANSNFQFDGISPNIFIVEENKRGTDDQKRMIQQRIKNNRKALHQYILGDSTDELNVSLSYFIS